MAIMKMAAEDGDPKAYAEGSDTKTYLEGDRERGTAAFKAIAPETLGAENQKLYDDAYKAWQGF